MSGEGRNALKLLLEECAQLADQEILMRLSTVADRELAREAASLLGYRGQAAGFLETPAIESADPWIGLQLSGYVLTSLIAEGGTSRVYRAERNDGQFRKAVAVKLLKSGIYGEDIRLRFLRERQLLAELDHPNIVRLIDGGVTAEARPYIVMDLVSGVPLSRYVRQNPAANVVALMKQAAAAVAYAHGKGVIHRDLKPGNILVTEEGQVKLLDFGIARLAEGRASDGIHTETQARLWTPAYASPEQARGEKARAESDLYSLGLILFELLHGRLPYSVQGLAQHEAIATICNATPREAVHPIVRRLLEKDPRKRGTAAELQQGLETLLTRGESLIPTRGRGRRLAAIAATAVVFLGAVAWRQLPRREISFPVPTTVQVDALSPSISPDGGKIAYLHQQSTDRRFLKVKDVASGKTEDLGAAHYFQWAPDGNRLAAVLDEGSFGTLSLIDYPSGRRTRLTHLPDIITRGIYLWHILGWTRDGREILLAQKAEGEAAFSIHGFDIESHMWRRLTRPPGGALGDSVAEYSPDGRTLAFVRFQSNDSSDVYVLRDGIERRLTHGLAIVDGITWMPDGSSLVISTRRGTQGARLWRVAVPGGGEPSIAVDLDGHLILPSIAQLANGRLRLAFHRRLRDVNVWMGDTSNESSDRAVTAPQAVGIECCGEPSPDGKRIALSSNRSGHYEIWLVDLERGIESQLTTMAGPYTDSPRWSPDGKWIAYTSAAGTNRDIFLISPEGGTARRFTTDPAEEGRPSWSRDGRWLYFRSARSGKVQMWRQPNDGSAPATQVTQNGGYEGWESHDGKYFYFIPSRVSSDFWRVSLQDQREELFFRLPYGGNAGIQALWGVGADGLYYWEDMPHTRRSVVKRVGFASRQAEQVRSISSTGEITGFRVNPFRDQILWNRADRNEDNIMIVDLP
ncbi:MAG: protein kinase [Bryobacterales bacterium]|nr:protein kinase [Bryobacterales bacterium]